MTADRVKAYLGIIAALGGAVAVLVGAFGWIQRISGTPAKLDGHIVAETTYHHKSDSTVKELDGHAEDLERLLETLVRGECIENPKKDLERQGLIRKCRLLGIER